jgi:CRP/FNR family cyclic AMP-dependent transcriptional regulator
MDHTLSLRSISAFEDLNRNDLISLADELQRRTFHAGEVIFSQGDPGNAMYIVESGEVRIHLSGNMPQPLSLRSLRPGEFFGELSMFDKQPRSATAVATVDTVLLELRHDAFVSYLSKRPQVAMTIFRTMSQRLRETNAMLSGQAARNVDEEFDRNVTWSDRLADGVAQLNGSWTFIAALLTITGAWCIVNSVLMIKAPPDPYPYQLFNLALGILVGLQGPLIMMSQNRQARKDRARADTDFKVNLKNELNIERMLRELNDLRTEVRRHRRDKPG